MIARVAVMMMPTVASDRAGDGNSKGRSHRAVIDIRQQPKLRRSVAWRELLIDREQ